MQRIAGSDRAAQASVAVWAFLHGAATLEAAQVLGEIKPASGLEFGFEAWLMAVSTRGEPIDAPESSPRKKVQTRRCLRVKGQLSTLYVGIGYPETWRDYSSYEVKADDIFGNLWRSGLFDYRRLVARLGHPVDRTDWCLYPQTIDACELPLQNALNFPAAYREPPNFDPRAPAAMNYAAIGSSIGHEISHTFDPQGSAFDSTGRVRNWWKPSDLAHFNAAAARLAAHRTGVC